MSLTENEKKFNEQLKEKPTHPVARQCVYCNLMNIHSAGCPAGKTQPYKYVEYQFYQSEYSPTFGSSYDGEDKFCVNCDKRIVPNSFKHGVYLTHNIMDSLNGEMDTEYCKCCNRSGWKDKSGKQMCWKGINCIA